MLDQPVTKLPGVGNSRQKLLHKLGLFTVGDVLFSYPRAYKDFTRVFSPDQLTEGQEALVYGRLANLQEKRLDRSRRIIQAQLLGTTGSISLNWFQTVRGNRASFIYSKLAKQSQLWVYGTVKRGFWGLEIASGEFYSLKPKDSLMPIYPLVSQISNGMRIRWIEFALRYVDQVEECLPDYLLEEYVRRNRAIKHIHFPPGKEELEQARRRLVFEEFFLFHLGLRHISARQESISHQADGKLVTEFLASLPFKLTKGQCGAIDDVRKDMENQTQMRRLIQGDVGSGKTVIAQYAALKAVDCRGQAAIMVPTEVLARQMYARLRESFSRLNVRVGLLVGKQKLSERQEILEQIKSGKIDILVGTHALISDNVEFNNLTLAVVDEQHRFGVRQRVALSDKGNADLLVMSATPIPRSLALTVYGDLDVTIIREMPAGRKPVDTRLIHPNQREKVYHFLTQRIAEGEQGFVIFPLVEESDKLAVKAAVEEMEYLSKGPLSSVRVGLVHGQMGKEKEDVLEKFYRKEYDVLVSTTVVEVGMNVPNATVMVIEDAQRFGLAQLHQLRGRVGRSHKQAYCFLVCDPRSESGMERLQVIRNTQDGLKIAEEDLRLRGPGDMLGTRQSGQPWFKLADIIEDQQILIKASDEARKLISKSPSLSLFPSLQRELKRQQS